jgi:glycosyltransferase involved in cell wall biosynthesis
MKLVMKSRRSLAHAADLCVLPAGDRARAFTSTTGRGDVHVVWNCPARIEAEAPAVRPVGDALRLLYHGSIVPARVPKEILYAIAALPPAVTLTVVGYETSGHESYVQELTALSAQLGLSGRIRFMGPMSRDELMQRCGDCDVGLSLLPMASTDINERSMVGASNKPFDYLARGLPIVVSELADWVETFVTPGFGRSCDPRSPESIALALRWMLEHPRERALMGECGRQRILDGWNYEAQFAAVLARMTAGVVDGAAAIEAAKHVKPTLPC